MCGPRSRDDTVTSPRGAVPTAAYLRQARMSICKMTSDYIRRFPSGRSRKDRSATRRERKATKTLAIVLGRHHTNNTYCNNKTSSHECQLWLIAHLLD